MADAAQLIAGHGGRAHGGVGAQPAPSLTPTLGGDHCQQVDIAQRCAQAATGIEVQAQIRTAQNEPVDCHAGAVAQARGLVALRFQEQIALGREHIGHVDAHAAPNAGLLVYQ